MLYFNGFQWVTRINTMRNIDPNFLSQTKKDRRVEIRNLPLYLGIGREDLREIITQFVLRHVLNDPGNEQPVLAVDLNEEKKSAVIELSSVEETHRMARLDCVEVLGVRCKLIRLAETFYGQETALVDRVRSAQDEAKAYGAVVKVMDMLDKNKLGNESNGKLDLPCELISPVDARRQDFQFNGARRGQTPAQAELRQDLLRFGQRVQ